MTFFNFLIFFSFTPDVSFQLGSDKLMDGSGRISNPGSDGYGEARTLYLKTLLSMIAASHLLKSPPMPPNIKSNIVLPHSSSFNPALCNK